MRDLINKIKETIDGNQDVLEYIIDKGCTNLIDNAIDENHELQKYIDKDNFDINKILLKEVSCDNNFGNEFIGFSAHGDASIYINRYRPIELDYFTDVVLKYKGIKLYISNFLDDIWGLDAEVVVEDIVDSLINCFLGIIGIKKYKNKILKELPVMVSKEKLLKEISKITDNNRKKRIRKVYHKNYFSDKKFHSCFIDYIGYLGKFDSCFIKSGAVLDIYENKYIKFESDFDIDYIYDYNNNCRFIAHLEMEEAVEIDKFDELLDGLLIFIEKSLKNIYGDKEKFTKEMAEERCESLIRRSYLMENDSERIHGFVDRVLFRLISDLKCDSVISAYCGIKAPFWYA